MHTHTTVDRRRLRAGVLGASLALVLLSSACVEVGIPASGNKPHAELNPIQGMHATPSYKDQEAQPLYRFDAKTKAWKADEGMRVPPNETLHTTYRAYPLEGMDAGKVLEDSKGLRNPVTITEDSLKYGALMYETTCIVCHGPAGEGKGYVIGENKYPVVPPSLTSPTLRQADDAYIYHVISRGKGSMWSYKNQLRPMERWAIVNYIRAMQRAKYPEPQDIERTRGQ